MSNLRHGRQKRPFGPRRFSVTAAEQSIPQRRRGYKPSRQRQFAHCPFFFLTFEHLFYIMISQFIEHLFIW